MELALIPNQECKSVIDNIIDNIYLGNYQMILDGLIKDYTLTINTYSGNNVKLATKAIVEQYVDKTWFSEIFLSAPISPDSKIGDIKVEDDESSDESIIEDDVILEFKVLYSKTVHYVKSKYLIDQLKQIITRLYDLALAVHVIRPIFLECFLSKKSTESLSFPIPNIQTNIKNIRKDNDINYILPNAKKNTNITINSAKYIIECIFKVIANYINNQNQIVI